MISAHGLPGDHFTNQSCWPSTWGVNVIRCDYNAAKKLVFIVLFSLNQCYKYNYCKVTSIWACYTQYVLILHIICMKLLLCHLGHRLDVKLLFLIQNFLWLSRSNKDITCSDNRGLLCVMLSLWCLCDIYQCLFSGLTVYQHLCVCI